MQNDWLVDHRDGGQLASHLRERALATLATRQYGAVAHRQLLALGFTRREIGVRLAAGRLRPLHRGVYLVGHGALHPRARWMAATLAGGEGALLSDRAALVLRDLLPVGGGRIDITVPKSCGRSFAELRVHQRELAEADRDEVHGIPCTSLARSLLDVSAKASHATVLEACERSVQHKLFDLGPLAELLERCRGQRGTRRLNAVLADLTDEPSPLRSELERRLRAVLLSSSLTRPELNRHLTGASNRLYEVDFHWPPQRLVVEADGAAYHSSRSAKERDARKQADLEAAGWRVLRVGWADVTRRPAATLHLIAAALRA